MTTSETVSDFDCYKNDPIIAHEVALKCIGEIQQPFIMAIEREKNKVTPNNLLVDENQKCLDKLFLIRHELKLEDLDLMAQIIDPNSAFRKNVAVGIIGF